MHPFNRCLPLVAGAALLLLLLAGCSSSAPYVWYSQLPAHDGADEYLISPGDMLGVRVFNQENMSTHARVRSDGRIAVPFLGDVEVRGKPPARVAKELEVRFKEYVVTPAVTITVEETVPTSVSVLGEVAKPGVYTIDSSSGVLQALAVAGGFTDYASRGSIYLVRHSPAQQRIRFTYAALVEGEGAAATFRLRAGDVLLVE
jgi:polysaccharide export outer membrane protein